MPLLYPTQGTLHEVFSPQLPLGRSKGAPEAAPISEKKSPLDRFTAWSAADDVKTKAHALSEEAQKEIAKASSEAQAKAGKVELYSPKFYAACTFGGLLACVSQQQSNRTHNRSLTALAGYHPYSSHAS